MLKAIRPALFAGLFICLHGFSFGAKATAEVTTPHREFAQQRLWLKLLQYNSDGVSEIKNDGFFFASTGRTDALAELNATLTAFTQQPQNICLFPARHQALVEAKLVEPFNYQHCNEFQEWLGTDSVQSITLVFADGYLKNPASFHGHLFLRIDSNNSGNGNLLDTSLNFGAVVPDDDDPVTYIAKGLFGGYQARYSAQPFYRHNLSYGEVELRNLWDYQLALTAQQAQLLAAHLWELSRTDYQYFFTSKNCAYYVARAIEVVSNNNLVDHNEWTVLPTDIVKRVHQPDQQLVHKISAKQSAQSSFQAQFHQLSQLEQTAVRALVSSPKQTPSSYEALTQAQQKRVLITLSSYYTFLERQQPDEPTPKQNKARVLRALLAFEPGNTLSVSVNSEPPHLSQPANLIRLSYRHYQQQGNAYALTLRPSFYDRLQPSAGKLPNSALSMGEVELVAIDHKLEVEKIWLLNIEALNVSSTGLAHDGGMSWMIRTGAERRRLRASQPKLSSFVEAGVGKAYQQGYFTPYAMFQGRIHTQEINTDRHNVTLNIRAGVEFDFGQQKGYCEVEQSVSVTSSLNKQALQTTCAASLFHTNQSDLRVMFSKQNEHVAQLGWSWYF